MENAQDNISPSKSYLAQFYLDIENLTTQVSNYNNLMAYLNEKHKTIEENELKPEEFASLDNFSQQCRFYANRVYVKYCALAKMIPEFETEKKTIIPLYKNVATKRIISFDEIQELTIAFNSLFVNGVCDKFFVDTQNAFAKISGQNP